ncbi:hypothetical protein QT972_15225 [Microcoleus sp. herbarium7]|uniref:hypothetical protein n=1 Tax=Microcoleus sp. herbarium13 TaxID=3055438 RepID=UPI002FD48D6F
MTHACTTGQKYSLQYLRIADRQCKRSDRYFFWIPVFQRGELRAIAIGNPLSTGSTYALFPAPVNLPEKGDSLT